MDLAACLLPDGPLLLCFARKIGHRLSKRRHREGNEIIVGRCTQACSGLGAFSWPGGEFPHGAMPNPSHIPVRGARQTFRMGGKRHRVPVRMERSRCTTLWAFHSGHGCAGDVVGRQRNLAGKGTLACGHRLRRFPDRITRGRTLADASFAGLGRRP